jgi:hypothetical protein
MLASEVEMRQARLRSGKDVRNPVAAPPHVIFKPQCPLKTRRYMAFTEIDGILGQDNGLHIARGRGLVDSFCISVLG